MLVERAEKRMDMAKVIGKTVKSTKIGTKVASAKVAKVEGKKKKGRIEFEVPAGGFESGIIEGLNFKKNKPLTKKDFADTAAFLEYRAEALKARAAGFVESAKKLTEKVEMLRKYGDDETRKKAEKLSKLREQMALLEKELEDQGIDIDEDTDTDEGEGEDEGND